MFRSLMIEEDDRQHSGTSNIVFLLLCSVCFTDCALEQLHSSDYK